MKKQKSSARKAKKPTFFGTSYSGLKMGSFISIFVVLGAVLTWSSFAATANTTFSGKLSAKSLSLTHTVATTASGSLTAKATLTRIKSAKLELLNSSGAVISSATSNTPQLSAPVGTGTYKLRITSSENGNYKIDVTYPVVDPAPPSDTIPPAAPAGLIATAVSTSQINLAWQSATDNTGVSGYQVYRNGAFVSNTVTTSYSDVNLIPATAYTYTVRAKDVAGNVSSASIPATATTLTPLDTTAPSASISTPVNGATLSGTVSIAGTASDNTALSKVEVQVDANGFVTASGTTAWSYSLNTALYPDGAHALTVRATDNAGNQSVSSITVQMSNVPPNSSTATPPATQGRWTSPEGMTIDVNTQGVNKATGKLWTISDIYKLILPEVAAPGDFAKIAPLLDIFVQDTYPSSTGTGASSVDGVYSNFSANIYLRGTSNSTFSSSPESIASHEYGHAWTLYHHFLSQNGNWTPYLTKRWVTADGSVSLIQDSRLNSSYNWTDAEMLGDDYRLLFGTQSAQVQRAYINSQVLDSRQQPGLKDWFLNIYAKKQ